MDLKDLIYQREGHVAVITLNRPQRRNALGGTLMADLNAALRDAEADHDVRCIILTGAGEAFCAGLDMKERGAGVNTPSWRKRLKGLETPKIMLAMNTPIVGAINGPAAGAGFEIALLCDYRIGCERSRMGDLHVKRGLIQDAGAVVTLPRVAGWANACKILLTGEMFSPQEMERMGVLNEVVPADVLMDAARSFAGRIAVNSPLALRMTKRLLRMAQRADHDVYLDYAMLMMGALQQEDDFKEGLRAFSEKREPEF